MEDPSESQLIEFAESKTKEYTFPFKMENLSREEQQKRLLAALEAAFNGKNSSIGDALSALNQRKSSKMPPKSDVFPINIDATLRKMVKEEYQRQLPCIMDEAASKDENFLTLLAMQKKHRFDVFQYLMTDFLRWCLRSHYQNAKNKDEEIKITEETWVKQCDYLKGLKPKDIDIVKHAITSFGSRLYPRLMMKLSSSSESFQ